MRIDRISPRSSVTFGTLLWGQATRCVAGSSERWLGVGRRIGQATEAGGGLGGGRCRRRAGALADAGQSAAQLGGRLRIELGQRIPDDPGAMAVAIAGGAVGLVAKGPLRRGAIHDGDGAVSPREGLLDVRLGVA